MEIDKSLDDKIQEIYERAFDLLYDPDACVKDHTGLNSETEGQLWDFVEGIGEYVGKVLSGRMSIAESLKDHISIIEKWESEVRQLIDNIEKKERRRSE